MIYKRCNVTEDIRFDSVDHLPESIEGNEKDIRQRCKLCSNKTISRCIKCELPLCILAHRNCFKKYHNY